MCLNNAILFDEAANDEADRHARMMQERRKFWDAIFEIHDKQVKEKKGRKQ